MKRENHTQGKLIQDSAKGNFNIPSKIFDWSLAKNRNLWHPPTDVYETTEQFIVTIEIAGITENDIDIELEKTKLSVCGKRNIRCECSAFHQIEINCGEFISMVDFVTPINQDVVTTKYLNGLLVIKLPKIQPNV